jgi:hypothetical protein
MTTAYVAEGDDEYSVAFQIDSDNGTTSFARSRNNPRKWAFEWPCY